MPRRNSYEFTDSNCYEHTKKRNQLCTYPVSAVRPSPYQARRHFDQKALDELAESIKNFRHASAISVRRQTGATYELVAGERRLRASKLAGLETIPAIIVDCSESDSALAALLENLQREDLSYMERAQSYYYLIKSAPSDAEEVAAKGFGKTQSTVAKQTQAIKACTACKENILRIIT